MTMRRRFRGMTMPELMVVIAIIALLATITIPVALAIRKRGTRATCEQHLLKVGQALIAYRQDEGVYPELPGPIGALSVAKPKLLNAIPTCPRDPEDHHDTYAEYYNYWGYDDASAPSVLDRAGAATLYQGLTDSASPKKYYWRGGASGNPDMDFPGLANANASNDTIVTICPWHTDEVGQRYVVLLLSGETVAAKAPKDDPLFWTLSKAK